jgi:phosphoglycolate phosphatase
MNVQLVIFDFDGTLADSYPWFLSIYSDFARRFQLPPMDRAELDALRRMDFTVIMKEHRISPFRAIQMGAYLKQLMSSQIDRVQLVSGIQEVIDALSACQVRLAVVSSNDEANVRCVLGESNAGRFFAFECGVSILGKTAKFHNILRKSGAKPYQALSIGDEIRDLKSSRQAGIPFGAVTWGYTDAERLRAQNPDFVFTHPLQILEALGIQAA